MSPDVGSDGIATMDMRRRTLLFGVLVVVTAGAHLETLRDLFELSRSDRSASHLVLIPLVSLALVLLRRDEIFASVRTNWPGGLTFLLAGVALTIAAGGFRPSADQAPLALRVAPILVLWAGAFLLVFGWSAASAARFALAFLVFTLPMPAVLIDGATEILKRGSSHAVAALFSLTGTPYHREGFVFSLPGLSIEVADACSGIRSSIALVMTALIAGHMFLKSGWTKVLLVLAILPVTIFKNGLRIVSLSLLATHVDRGFLAGPLHTEGGIAFFLLALVLLLPVFTLLRRWEAPRRLRTRTAPAL